MAEHRWIDPECGECVAIPGEVRMQHHPHHAADRYVGYIVATNREILRLAEENKRLQLLANNWQAASKQSEFTAINDASRAHKATSERDAALARVAELEAELKRTEGHIEAMFGEVE